MNSNGDLRESFPEFRPLYLACSLDGLMKKSEEATVNIKPTLKRYTDWMKRWDMEAKKARASKDQELEFINLYRYMNMASKIHCFPEYNKHSEIYQNDLIITKKNMKLFENLQNTLQMRYKEMLNKSASGDNNKADKKVVEPSKKPIEVKKSEINNSKVQGQTKSTSIDCCQLYSLIKSNASLLVLDVRSKKDFEESHLTWLHIINIPNDIIKKGDSASTLGEKLTNRSLWNKRHTFDKLVMLDWDSKESTLSNTSPICWLAEAMLKWDPSVNYKCPPLILEGGFEDLLSRYPLLTTNPKVESPSTTMSTINYLDSCDYPMHDLEVMKENIVPSPAESQSFHSSLIIDRSTKPKLKSGIKLDSEYVDSVEEIKEEGESLFEQNSTFKELHTTSSSDNSSPEISTTLEEQPNDYINTEPQKVDDILKPPPIQQDSAKLLEELRKVKPEKLKHPSLPMRHINDAVEEDATYTTVGLKREGTNTSSNLKRSSSSPNIAQDLRGEDIPMKQPPFTRLNKPRLPTYGEKTDATYGSTALGLTGLKNFANNCYMNSILQCLSNTEALVKELINLNKPQFNNQSKTKGRVALEVIQTLRSMWSGEIRVYSIKELKELMGNMKDIFKGTAHQDSNEFLIILLEYLHEDLKAQENFLTLTGADENSGEKAWGEFKRKNSSVIQRLFYGQQKSTVTCSTCNHSSITFEPFFNLFVPIPATSEKVTLLDCIQLYMSGENITGWKCPKCQGERNATKKFDISKLPPILIIALKRFTQEDDSWLHKKENTVMYPLQNLDMKRFTVKNSEQRYMNYELYAVSTHSGTLKSGHYKAICKNCLTGKWYMFDDQFIDPLSTQRVKDHPDAYILFYNAVGN